MDLVCVEGRMLLITIGETVKENNDLNKLVLKESVASFICNKMIFPCLIQFAYLRLPDDKNIAAASNVTQYRDVRQDLRLLFHSLSR